MSSQKKIRRLIRWMLALLAVLLLADAALVFFQSGAWEKASGRLRSLAEKTQAAAEALAELSPPAMRPLPAAGDAAAKPVLTTEAPQLDVLTLGSRWSGLLRISAHKGKGSLKNGSIAVRAVIDCDREGSFFELFRAEDPDSAAPLLSMPVLLDYDTLRPQIGQENARFYDIWLEERDEESLTMQMADGTLAASFFYDDGKESCQIDFRIKQENST